jgi:TrmH family RNA methyltransferase
MTALGYQVVRSPIRIVLVGTSHPGNIGAVARAMKNMALDELVLVKPHLFPHPEASARASGAEDILQQARIEPNLIDGLAGCGLILATTSRERDQNFRVLDARAAARRAVEEAERGPVAIMFGAERTGLTNDELQHAHALLCIPANPAHVSLNVAMAAQIVAYEVMCARLERTGSAPRSITRPAVRLASPTELEGMYIHLEQVLQEIDFRDRTQTGTHLMKRIRRLLQRAEPDLNELNILRGILTAIQQRRRRAGQDA